LETVANTVENITDVSAMIPTDGFSMNSLLRGILGMLALLVIAFLLSTNKKAINWKTIGFGLMAQLILAVGVLKVPFVQASI
jgi:CNT family concentrative nucleoside transporter